MKNETSNGAAEKRRIWQRMDSVSNPYAEKVMERKHEKEGFDSQVKLREIKELCFLHEKRRIEIWKEDTSLQKVKVENKLIIQFKRVLLTSLMNLYIEKPSS